MVRFLTSIKCGIFPTPSVLEVICEKLQIKNLFPKELVYLSCLYVDEKLAKIEVLCIL